MTRATSPDSEALREAGFVEPREVQSPLISRLPSCGALLEVMESGTVRTAGLLRAQSPRAREAIRAAVAAEARHFQKGNAVELPMPAILATAAKL